jgi:diguanylate cyclase (GGDEF)-like protein/PAS domain S-box-containing protein
MRRVVATSRELFASLATPTAFATADGALVYANPAFDALLGYQAGELEGLDFGAVVHADDVALLGAQCAAVAAGTLEGCRIELRCLRKNGEIVRVAASASRLAGDREFPSCLILQALDIDRFARSEAALTELESRWNFALESAGHGFWDRDAANGRDFVSPMWKRMRGFDPEDKVCDGFKDWLTRVHPEDQDRILSDACRRERNATDGGVVASEHRELHCDGRWMRILSRQRTVAWFPNGEPARIMGVDTDITSVKEAEEKLQFANTLLRTEMDASPDGILVVDANARIISFNRRFADMWNIPVGVLEEQDDAPVLQAVTAAVVNPTQFVERVLYLYAHPEEEARDEIQTLDGRSIDRHSEVLRTPAGEHLGRVWFFRDVTERKLAEAQILRLARSDALTGLANRLVFMEEVQNAIAGVKRGDMPFAVLYLDLDQFKDVNDTLGHPVGDDLIKAVAGRLLSNVRVGDIVARFGGDEFAVLLRGIREPADAAAVADALAGAMREPFVIQEYDIRSGVSIGVAMFGPDEPTPATMLSRADIALYQAKTDRIGGYRFHTEAMDGEIRTRVTLGSELREGIASGQLFLVYQPQVELETGRVSGLEALVRWRHPTRGVLGPNQFIPIAEKSGLIATLGHWVMREACRQTKAWAAAGHAPEVIAVNLSGVQFKRAFELEREIAVILAETGLPARQLELELTETVLMEASREHSDVLDRLREKGVRLAIDDFGVGYSSLDYLRRFPADRIKIAQPFVAQIATEAGSAAIVKATIGLARELGIMVIAEGVETFAQLDLLRAWGCREGQGYYMARPLAVEDVTPLLKRGRIALRQRDGAKTAA